MQRINSKTILMVIVLVGGVVITKITKLGKNMLHMKNYGTNTEQPLKIKKNNDNLEEAMMVSDGERENKEAEVMKSLEET